MNKKGQIATYDLLFAIIIFMGIFVLMNSIWVENYSNAIKKEETKRMQFSAKQAMKIFVDSSGYPADWTSGNVEIPGLLREYGAKKISNEKITELAGMDYDAIRSLLKIEEYDFFLSIDALGESHDQNIGTVVPANSKAVQLERVRYYQGGAASIALTLFK